MPTVFVTQNEDLTTSNLFDGGDEVNDLNILRLMAKRSYIISCYESVVESKNYSNTGKSMSEALIFASTNPQYDYRLFIELQVQYMKIPSSNLGRTCCVQKFFLTFRTFFVHKMFSTCS